MPSADDQFAAWRQRGAAVVAAGVYARALRARTPARGAPGKTSPAARHGKQKGHAVIT